MARPKADVASSLFESVLVCFVTLKLAGLVTWSWWFVLAPFWVPALFAGLLLLVYWVLNRAKQ